MNCEIDFVRAMRSMKRVTCKARPTERVPFGICAVMSCRVGFVRAMRSLKHVTCENLVSEAMSRVKGQTQSYQRVGQKGYIKALSPVRNIHPQSHTFYIHTLPIQK